MPTYRPSNPTSFVTTPHSHLPLTLLLLASTNATAADQNEEIVLPKVTVTRDAAPASVSGYVTTRSTSASKTDTPLLETPQSISVISSDLMAAQNVSSLAETLRYSPGIQGETFGFEPRTTFIKIRGFDVTQTGLFKDGLKLSNPNFVIGYSLEPYGAERVEIPRGPVSVLYGQAGAGGLVNYVTKRPLFDTFGEITFESGSYDRFQGEVDTGGTLGEDKTVAYRFTGVVRDSDSQVDFVENNRLYLAPALTWKAGEQTTLTILSHYQKDDTQPSQRLPAAGTLSENTNGRIPTERFTGEPGTDSYKREEFAVAYLLEHQIEDMLTFKQNVRYYENQVDDRTIYPTALLNDQRTVSRALYESFGEVRGLTLDNQLHFEFSTGPLQHKSLAGIDYQHTDSDSVQTFGSAPNLDLFSPVYGSAVAAAPIFKNESTTLDQIGIYLQDQIKFADHWHLALGGRYDYADSETTNHLTGTDSNQSDSAFTGRAGLVYLADNGLAPYFSYARSFLPVSGTDANGDTFVPETGEQFEFGLKFQPDGYNSFVTLAFFELTRKNFLTPDPITFENVQRGEARSKGIELEGTADLDAGLNLTANYTYLEAEVTQSSFTAEIGEPLEYTPEHKASLWADYTVQEGIAKDWGLGAGVRYIGTSYGNSYAAKNDIRIPGVVLFDANVHYQWRQLQFAVNMHNVLDKEYIATAFTSGGEFATFGPRRMVIGSIKYSF